MPNSSCPESKDIGEIKSDLRLLRLEVERLRDIVIINAETRVHRLGLEEGKKAVWGSLIKRINMIAYILGVFVLLTILSAIGIAVAGVDTVANAVSNALKFIWKVM